MKDEGEVKDFLGTQVQCDPTTKTITLMQPGLIDSVLQDPGLLAPDSHPNLSIRDWQIKFYC